jgi:hypothetical protein
MNVFFISFEEYEYDGRVRELIKAAKELGDIKYVTRGVSLNIKQGKEHYVFIGNGIFGYIKFILYVLKVSTGMGNTDILFIDNRKAIIPALFLNLITKPKYTIQDVRELYLINEVKHFSGKIGCILEKYFMKKASIIICANKYRSEIMKNHFNLKSYPLVLENIIKLEYTEGFSKEELDKKYGSLFDDSKIKLISTSGCSIDRTNDKLVEAMFELGDKYDLFLVGGGSEQDIYKIKNMINDKGISNVHLIDRLKVNELKYFLKKCDIGIVNYHKKDMNNKYCASGRIYEFLFEGLPVVTTENLPLIDVCNNFNVGVADDSYKEGIKEVAERYAFYAENVKRYINNLDKEKHFFKLAQEIKESIKNMG